MSRLLRSLKFTGESSCWRNFSVTLKALTVASFIVLWGTGDANAQVEFPCEISLSCPDAITVECGTDLSDFDVLGFPIATTEFCQGTVLNYLNTDVVLSSDGCTQVIVRTWTVSIIGGPSAVCAQTITVSDTQGPVFDSIPAATTYQCADDVPAIETLTATDNCDLSVVVTPFEVETGADTLDCVLTTPIGPGPDWAVWLNGLTAAGLASNDYYAWVPGTAFMNAYADGTAQITGDIINLTNPTETWTATFWMQNGKNWVNWSSLGRSYKDDFGTNATTHLAWTYYELVPVFSNLVGTGSNLGSTLYLSHQPSNYYFGFQFGQGANNRNAQQGGSGWFYYTGVVDGESVSGHGDVTTDKSCIPNTPNTACLDSFLRVWRAEDECGNITFASQLISVDDTIAPTFVNCPESYTVQCSDSIPEAFPFEELIAIDNCDDTVTISIEFEGVMVELENCITLYRYQYRAEDNCGNFSNCEYTVTIVDTEAPVVTAPADVTYECDETILYAQATAIDDCHQASVVITEGISETNDLECGYEIIRSWTATDGCGNFSEPVYQTITITDTTPPVFSAYPIQLMVECELVDSIPGPTATDNCDSTITVTYVDTLNSGGCLGVIARTYTATDDCGNTATALQYIALVDTTGAEINAPADFTIECNEEAIPPVLDIVDNCGLDVTVEFRIEVGQGECEYDILWIWEALDYCENPSSDTTVVHVIDSTPPSLILPNGGTFACDQDVIYGEVIVGDNCDDSVTVSFTDSTIAGDCPQSYSIIRTWVAVDNCDNTTTGSVTYEVVDDQAPVFGLDQLNYFSYECDDVIDTIPVFAFDLCGDVTYSFEDVDFSEPPCFGLIVRTWTATDECGNYSTFDQYISISDTTAPVIDYTFEITLPCDDYSGIYATASDNCDDSVEVFWINDSFVSGGCEGRIIRTYYAQDDCGNSTQVEQFITLIDVTAPVVVDQSENVVAECGDEFPEVFATFEDNCDDELTYSDSTFTTGDICSTVYHYVFSATDNCGNTVSTEVLVTVTDSLDPYFGDIPSDITVNCYEEIPSAIMPEAFDLCDDSVEVEISDDTLFGDCPSEYTIVRTYRAIDNCGHQAVESSTITVVDVDAPYFLDQELYYFYECDESIDTVSVVAVDECSTVSYTFEDEDFSELPCFGLIVRTWTATDACGNFSTFSQYISIADTTAPVISGTIEVTMPCDDISDIIMVSATDNCDDSVEVSILSTETASGTCAGRLIRVYRAYDDCGNFSEFTQFITLTDSIAPVASADPADATYECDEDWVPAEVTFVDNCDDDLLYTPISSATIVGCSTVYTYVWTATDHCGNSTSVDQVITVTDTTAPYASFTPENYTFECGEDYILEQPSFFDACDDSLTIINDVFQVADSCVTTITYTWIVADDCGNTLTLSQVITIEDTTAPLIEVPFSTEFSCEDEIEFGVASAVDVCDSEVEITHTDSIIPGDCPQSYTIVRTWTATDDCGNSSSEATFYYVYDNTAPVFGLDNLNYFSYECDDVIDTIPVVAFDLCGDVTYSFEDVDYSEPPCFGLIVRTWTASDECGNFSTFEQYISISDTTAPVITGPFEATMPCDDISDSILVSVTDNCDENPQIVILSDEFVSGACANRILRIYRAYDACQNFSDFIQFITLTDVTAPVASTVPVDATYECDETWSAATVTFEDNCDEALVLESDTLIVTTGCTTVYTFTWTATDHCQNSTTVDQVITVVDETDPEFDSESFETTVSCGLIVDFLFPTASDNCDDDVEITPTTLSFPGECPGEYTEISTFVAMDNCGNTSTISWTVHYVDETAPILENIPANGEFECDDILPTAVPTAVDFCSVATVIAEDSIIAGQCPNSYTIVHTYYAVDECGNESEPVFVYYSIYDNTDPEFTSEPVDEEYQCLDLETYSPQSLTATDNCGEATVTYNFVPVELDSCGNGTWVVIYTATDLCFNTSTVSYEITILDTTDPILSSNPASVMLDCDAEIPAVADVTATDNCDDNVEVTFTETCLGDCPTDGEIEGCDLTTPAGSNAGCYVNGNWAMLLPGMPSAHEFYVMVDGTGNLVDNGDGSITATGTLVNQFNPGGGFTFDVTFGNELSWEEWSTQSFPTSFKQDCGGQGVNHEQWLYYILQNTAGAELVGWGIYAGSSLDITHAPANKYFGFQYGDGANNQTGGNGLGGWFEYHGIFLVNGNPLTSGFAQGLGDFAWDVDCCHDYQIVRCWSAMDCSGNETSYCQTISFGDLDGDFGDPAPLAPMVAVENGNISIVGIQPNPATERSQISFTSKQDGKLSLQVMDMTGRIVADLYNNTVVAGTVYRADFDANKLGSGMYMVRLSSDTESDFDRIQITK